MIFKFLKNNCTHHLIRKTNIKVEEHLCDCCHKQLFVDETKNSEIILNDKMLEIPSYIDNPINSMSTNWKKTIPPFLKFNKKG